MKYKDKTILITGGTGSFGSAAVRRFLQTDVKEIRILSRDEKKQDDMRRALNSTKVKYYIGDTRQRESVDVAVNGADIIFHAAALKQVPSCEFFPMEAVRTNIIGTENVLNSAIDFKVKSVVVLSTDKAAYPINAMGISKAMMEKVAIAASRTSSDTVISCTRYGNVLASRGSVLPLFAEQIKSGGTVTITHKDMTRFIMTLEDSIDLVEYAIENAQSGDIFVQKAPSCYILDLANAIKAVMNSNCEIKEIGIRHGEKLYETLLTAEEHSKAVDIGNFFRVPADNRDLNYELYFSEGNISKNDGYNSLNTRILPLDELTEIIRKAMDKIV